MFKDIKKLFKMYGFRSLLFKNFLFTFAFILLSFSILIASLFTALNQTSLSQFETISYSNAKNMVSLAETKLEEAFKAVSALDLNENIRMFMISEESSSLLNSNEKIVQELIFNTINSSRNYYSLLVYSNKSGQIISRTNSTNLNQTLDDTTWMENFNELPINKNMVIYRKYKGIYPNCMTIIRIFGNQQERHGCIVLDISLNEFGASFETTESSSSLTIYKDDNTYIYDKNYDNFLIPETDEDTLDFLNNQKKYQTYPKTGIIKCKIRSNRFGCTYVTSTNMNDYLNKVALYEKYSLFCFIIFFILAFIIAFVISQRVFTPMLYIMNILEKNTNERKIKNIDNKDIVFLVDNITKIIEQNKTLEENILNNINTQKNLQLQIMQKQIAPHFLNNTLAVINNEAIKFLGINNNISNVTIKLSNLLRHTLVTNGGLISVKEEIRFLKLYIDIMNIRYPHIKIEMNINPEIYNYNIIGLSLQPILENAYHFSDKRAEMHPFIKINGYIKNSRLIFEIIDNGCGISPNEIKNLREHLKEEYTQKTKNIGLQNVYRRLKLVFGDDADLTLESIPGKHTKITIIIPIER